MSRKLKDVVAEWWVENARIRNGHPPRDEKISAPVVSSNGSSGLMGKLLPGLALASLLGLPIGGYLLGSNSKDEDVPPPAVEPQVRDGSIYQYIQDNNWHLE